MGGPFGRRPHPPGRVVPRPPTTAQIEAYQRETAAVITDIKTITKNRQMPHVMEACVQVLAQIALLAGLSREQFMGDCGRAYDAYAKAKGALGSKPG